MPFEITWEPNGIYCRCYGPVTAADVSYYLNQIAAHPAFDGFRYRITDALGVSPVSLSADELRWIALAREIHAHRNRQMVDALVTSDERNRSLWRQLVSVSRDPQRFADFASVSEARAWIARELEASALEAGGR
jgi:hypothetical protein